MRRLFAVLAALVAVLFYAPAAFAGNPNIVVNDNGDAPDANPSDGICDTDTDPANGFTCTLRAAIQTANARVDPDTITFTTGGQAPTPATALPLVTDTLTIDGGGATTVTYTGPGTGTLLDFQAANSILKAITIQGGAAGTTVNLSGSGDRLDTVTIRSAGTGVHLNGPSQRIDNAKITSSGGTGILASGNNATINGVTITAQAKGIDIAGNGISVINPEISGGGADAIAIPGSGATVSGGHIHDNGGNGVHVSGSNDSVSKVTFYGNGGKPIAVDPGANGGIAPPQARIGPRRADGTLPLNGTGSPGTIELWSGDPSSKTAPSLFVTFASSGDFSYTFGKEPAPGTMFSLSLTGSGLGTSEFVNVAVPDDVVSPDVTFARALDTNNVRIDFSEPLDPASVTPDDFKLTMAGVERPIAAVTPAPDGRSVVLNSSGWRAGEAGYVDFTSAGDVTDAVGNQMLSAPHLRVAAAPGDFIAPLGGKLQVTPATICLTHSRTCRHTGMTIKFVTTEAGKARLLIKRSDVTVGSRVYGNIVPGLNTLKFNGRLGSRKLRAGRYRLLMYVQDPVGNVTDQPPIVLFNVRRATP